MRDIIQKREIKFNLIVLRAYPSTYYSFDNIDFGTVQGFTLGYNLRADKNITLRANYTLQFAKGTGSSAGSNLAIIASGQPNLRTLTNLSFDQRHRFNVSLDYRFGMGSEYNGPTWKRQSKKDESRMVETRLLENTGVTFYSLLHQVCHIVDLIPHILTMV